MLYGYTGLAGELNRRLGLDPPVSGKHVYMWRKRATRNAAGAPFPLPSLVMPKTVPGGRLPTYEWELAPVLDWALAGIRASDGHAWRYPQLIGN